MSNNRELSQLASLITIDDADRSIGITTSVGIGTTNPGAKLNVVDNSSSDALRITQTGSGNALVVEDSENPDATPFVVSANGFVGIGTTNPNQIFEIYSGGPSVRLTDFDDNSYSRLRYNRTASQASLILEADGANQNPDVTDISFRIGGVTSSEEKVSISSSKFIVGLGGTVLTANLSGSVGIGTTNPTTTLQVQGTTKVETSIGSTQSVWTTTLDSKGNASNVSLLVQPETAYSFNVSQTAIKIYQPVVFSNALTSANGSYSSFLYGLANYTNLAGTASTSRVVGYGFFNQVSRNSTTDVSSYSSNSLPGTLNNVIQGTNVDQSVVTGFLYGTVNQVLNRKATATNIYGNYNLTSVGVNVNFSASSTNTYGVYNLMQVGAASGTGIGTLTNYYGYYGAPTVALTGQLTNYYGIYLATPIVNGTLTNRYSIYSSDASSPMYHAGSVGIGTTNPGSKLDVNGTLNVTGVSTFQDNVNLGDNDRLRFGDDQDLQIYHSGTDSIINDVGTGSLILAGSSQVSIRPAALNEFCALFNANSSVELYYDNDKKLETTGYGVTISGGLNVSGVSTFVGVATAQSTLFANQLSVSGVSTISVNSSNDALRITQLGTGNALVVEDETNPDATPFVITATGSVGIGTNNPSDKLHIKTSLGSIRFSSNGSLGSTIIHANPSNNATYAFQNNGGSNELAQHVLYSSSGSYYWWIGGQASSNLKMRLTSDGNLGIGTDNPGAKLTVSGNASITGNLGIGTTNPAEELHLYNSQNEGTVVRVENPNTGTAANASVRLFSDTATVTHLAHGSGRVASRFGTVLARFGEISLSSGNGLLVGTQNASPLILGTNDTEALRIDSSQNVGIGTTNPNGKLEILDANKKTAILIDDNSRISIGSSDTILYSVASPAGAKIKLSTFADNGSVLSSTMTGADSYTAQLGELLIEGTTPGVAKAAGQTWGIRFHQADGTGDVTDRCTSAIHAVRESTTTAATSLDFKVRAASGNLVTRQRINSSGNVLIGSVTDTGTTDQKLQVNGRAYIADSVGIGTTNALIGIGNSEYRTSLYVVNTIDDSSVEGAYSMVVDTWMNGTQFPPVADAEQAGLYVKTRSDVTAGTTGNEHQVYGIRNQLLVNGDSDIIYGFYNTPTLSHTAGTVTTYMGKYNVVSNTASSTTTSMYATYNYSSDSATGNITTTYGAYNLVQSNTSSSGTRNIYGNRNRVNFASGSSVSPTTIIGTWSNLDNDAGVTQASNGLAALFYGSYDSTTGYNKPYGIYITTNVTNYLRGSTGIGITNPGSGLQIAGDTEELAGVRLTNDANLVGDTSATGWLLYQKNDNALTSPSGLGFRRNSTEILSINTDGNIVFPNGQGIDFGDSQGGGTTSSILDDYEEGTWTPVVADASSGGNTASGTFYGLYTKVGNLVTLLVSCTNINTTGMTAGNDLFIQGIPFAMTTLSGTNFACGAVQLANTTVANNPVLEILDATQYIRITETVASAARDLMIVSEFTSGSADIYGTITYPTAT